MQELAKILFVFALFIVGAVGIFWIEKLRFNIYKDLLKLEFYDIYHKEESSEKDD